MDYAIRIENMSIALDRFFRNMTIEKTRSELIAIVKNILNGKSIEGLNEYSKKVLALIMEKKIILSIEKMRQEMHASSFWRHFKTSAPLINNRENILSLSEYIDVYINDINTIYPENETLKEIADFYDQQILAKQQAIAKSIQVGAIPSLAVLLGMVVSLNHETIFPKQLFMDSQTEIESNQIALFDEIEPMDLTSSIEIDIPVFVGYDTGCPLEYQQYIYDISKEYGVSFNVMMSIFHRESNGTFKTNGVKSPTNDYGSYQINEINLAELCKHFGCKVEDILNDPYLNFECAAYLLQRIYKFYPEVATNDEAVIQIFGCYNGWLLWERYDESVEYAEDTFEKYRTIYNKTDCELYDHITIGHEKEEACLARAPHRI